MVDIVAWHQAVQSLLAHTPAHILSVDSVHKLQLGPEYWTAKTLEARHTRQNHVVVLALEVQLG